MSQKANGHTNGNGHVAAKTRQTTSAAPGWLKAVAHHQLEISLGLLIAILVPNALVPPEYVLSTRCTPEPSYHLKHIHSKFLFLSFRHPGKELLFYKGRE